MKRNYEIAVISKGAFARTVRIFAPKNATKAVVIHDGGAFFTQPKNNIVATVKKLRIKNTAIIGVDCGDRLNDYLPFPVEQSDAGFPSGGGKADEYCDYITSALIPYLGKRFGFKSYAMLGVATAAAATLYAATRSQDIFSAFGIIAPPLFLAPKSFDKLFRSCRFPAARYFIHTAKTVNEPFLQNTSQSLFTISGGLIASAMIGGGASSVILNTNETDACGFPAAPVTEFITKFSKLR